MKTIRRNYYLVKFAEGSYMGAEHATAEAAAEHIKRLKQSADKQYRKRDYKIINFIETEEEISI